MESLPQQWTLFQHLSIGGGMRLKEVGSKRKRHCQKKWAVAPQAVRCDSCIHKRNLRVGNVTFDRIRCCHSKLMEIQEKYPERKPSLTAARALNELGKGIKPKINPAAYRNRFFYWPYCYNPIFVESCSGFEKAR
jgi:hypothetical protein